MARTKSGTVTVPSREFYSNQAHYVKLCREEGKTIVVTVWEKEAFVIVPPAVWRANQRKK